MKRRFKTDKFCKHCFHETKKDPACGEQDDGFYCTKPKGHSGDHVACSIGDGKESIHEIHRWKRIVLSFKVCGVRRIWSAESLKYFRKYPSEWKKHNYLINISITKETRNVEFRKLPDRFEEKEDNDHTISREEAREILERCYKPVHHEIPSMEVIRKRKRDNEEKNRKARLARKAKKVQPKTAKKTVKATKKNVKKVIKKIAKKNVNKKGHK